MTEVFQLAISGFLIVFMVLLLITLLVSLLQRLDKMQPAASKAAKEQTIDNLTLVLISAAVTAMLQQQKHRIRRIHRIPAASQAGASWSSTGRVILHGSHVITKHSPQL